jgi:hypothetical protein
MADEGSLVFTVQWRLKVADLGEHLAHFEVEHLVTLLIYRTAQKTEKCKNCDLIYSFLTNTRTTWVTLSYRR